MTQEFSDEIFEQFNNDPPESLFGRFKKMVQRGILGLNKGIPTYLRRMDQHTCGTLRGDYILVGAETGVGKTKFVRDQYIDAPFEYMRANPDDVELVILDVSMEMTAEDNIAEQLSKKIYKDTGRIIQRKKMFGQGQDNTLTEEEYRILDSYADYVDQLSNVLYTHDSDVTPTIYHNLLFELAKKYGTFENPHATIISKAGKYTPNNPKLHVIIIFDTINLADTEDNQVQKQSIDRISRLSVWFRKVCMFTPVIVQQFNAEISSTDRSRYGISTPLLRDFEDSKRTTKDATIVFGLFDPVRHEMTSIIGYNVERLAGWIRTLHLLKNRNGDANKTAGLHFSGMMGIFRELPKAADMTQLDYERATRPQRDNGLTLN